MSDFSFALDDFKEIPGQIGERSGRVLISVQETIMAWTKTYSYVELGSYAGRSLHPHIKCPACTYALSVDLRPPSTPDERGEMPGYDLVTVEMMTENLRRACGADALEKLETLTGTSADLPGHVSGRTFDLAFIDAEHTVRAAFADFLNVIDVMKPDSLIAFDDLRLVFPAVEAAGAYLEKKNLPHRVVYTHNNIALIQTGAYAQQEAKIRPRMITTTEGARRDFFDAIRRFESAE